MIQRWQRRLVEWIVERQGGEIEWPYEYAPSEPDYYDEDGNAVYDYMQKRLHSLMVEHKEGFVQMMEFLPREGPVIRWAVDE
jgi:hypothetical protein